MSATQEEECNSEWMSHWVADILVRFDGQRLSKRSGQGCPQSNQWRVRNPISGRTVAQSAESKPSMKSRNES